VSCSEGAKQAINIPHGAQDDADGDRCNDEPDDDKDGNLGSLAQLVPFDDAPLLLTTVTLGLGLALAFRFAGTSDQGRVGETLGESDIEEQGGEENDMSGADHIILMLFASCGASGTSMCGSGSERVIGVGGCTD
jgi:hypothetical protein